MNGAKQHRHKGIVRLKGGRVVITVMPANATAHGIATDALNAARAAVVATTGVRSAKTYVRQGAVFAELECVDTVTACGAALAVLRQNCEMLTRPAWDTAELPPVTGR